MNLVQGGICSGLIYTDGAMLLMMLAPANEGSA